MRRRWRSLLVGGLLVCLPVGLGVALGDADGVPRDSRDTSVEGDGSGQRTESVAVLLESRSFSSVGLASDVQIPWNTNAIRIDRDGVVDRSPLALPSGFLLRALRPTDDGGVVALGSLDLRPGEARADGPMVDGLAFPLLEFHADGSLESQVDLRIVGENVTLLAVDGDEVILERTPGGPISGSTQSRVVARDLHTGSERVIATTDGFFVHGDRRGSRLVLAGRVLRAPTNTCGVRWWNLGATPADGEISDCSTVDTVRISPDGNVAVVVYRSSARTRELRAATLDLRTGGITHQASLGPVMAYGERALVCAAQCPDEPAVQFAGSSWQPDGALLLALAQHPSSNDPRDLQVPSSIRFHIERP